MKIAFSLKKFLVEKVTEKNDKLNLLQFLFNNCHPDFSIFLPKTYLEVELKLNTRIV